MIFRPKPKEGPRLQELRVQTSSYGSTIPKLFGTMRVAGTVIWSTDLIEKRTREGGKGRPRTTRYSYSASFAVLLSGRPILGVRRIWADGNLLRGAAGDWKHATGFRLHLGGADQPVDPLIAAVEGAAPAIGGAPMPCSRTCRSNPSAIAFLRSPSRWMPTPAHARPATFWPRSRKG